MNCTSNRREDFLFVFNSFASLCRKLAAGVAVCANSKTLFDMKAIKRIILLAALAIAVLLLSSCSTARHSGKAKRPSNEQITAALDSICAEGYRLFLAETVNWVATDSALAHYEADRLGGNIIWQPDPYAWEAVFFNRQQDSALFVLRYDPLLSEYNTWYTPRPVNAQEEAQWEWKSRLFTNGLGKYGDSIRYNSNYGNPNVDIIRIDSSTTRMYILQGVERPNVIPFGNDYSIDFDNAGKAIRFRRYHQGFLPMPTVDENGEKVVTIYHSHVNDNPYITPTDICNFLLYRGEMKQTFVLSTALDGYIIYSAETGSAVFLTREAMEKINGHASKESYGKKTKQNEPYAQ